MADELTLSASLSYEDTEYADLAIAITEKLATVATKKFIRAKQNIGTSEEALALGEVTSPGWAFFINRDVTNFINLKVATSGAIFAKLLPGEFAMLRLGSGAQAPYAIADTAACQLEYMLVMT